MLSNKAVGLPVPVHFMLFNLQQLTKKAISEIIADAALKP